MRKTLVYRSAEVSLATQLACPLECSCNIAAENLCFSETFKLIADLRSGHKHKLKEFCANIAAPYDLIHPAKYDLFYKNISTIITDETRRKLTSMQ